MFIFIIVGFGLNSCVHWVSDELALIIRKDVFRMRRAHAHYLRVEPNVYVS